ncbi:unnamed protein product [Bursaphelenchus okinawaensis]|uniref:Fucosyltransferase n=1 Tax=Bursaphelenchus okinawaensis TaxID=465554 RepID=A0A811KBJ2_9BILA|nr:unnamed protein product [Bursaphelenchus okinawaensis]CAG9100994.1 unnamed protein product [Bursaphelenchus okinawaensis]
MNRTEEELDEIVAKKSKLALIFSSHDNVKSGRETMVRYLQGYMNITALGKTFTKDRCNDTCYRQETESHFFYLAFENQICDEYTTEKFGRFTHFVVPIVFKRSVVYKEFPDEYYIAMDDFDTTEEFVAFLKKVAGDKELYKNYLRWSQTPELRQMFDPTEASCGLCELAHLQPKKIGNYKKEHSSKECDSEFTPNWIKHNGKAAN